MDKLLKDQYSLRKKLIIAALIASILPFILLVSWPTAAESSGVSLKAYTLFATSVFGLIGALIMLWEFLLGTRVLIRKVFPDMIWSLKLHRWLGTYGSLLVWLHPLLAIYSLGLSFWYVFSPNFSSRYETYISYGRIAFLLFIAIWVTSAVVRGRIKYRPWKYIHLSSYVLLPLVLLHAMVNGIQLAQSSLLLYYWYGLAIVYLILVAVRVGYQFGYGKQAYKIINIKTNGDLAVLQLRHTDRGSAITPKPGQYVYLQLDSVFSESHPFTVSDYNPNTKIITLVIRKFGKFTDKILQLDKRESVLIDGPYGVFTDELNRMAADTSVPIVMFAGGIGVTPYIQHAKTAGGSDDSLLFNCNQSPQTTLFADVLKHHFKGRYIEVFSRLKPDLSYQQANTEFGYINKEIVQKYLKYEPSSYLYFICGPEPFMKSLKSILAELGVPKTQVRLEEFNF